MEFLIETMRRLADPGVLIFLGALAVVFVPLQHFFPLQAKQRQRRRGIGTDLLCLSLGVMFDPLLPALRTALAVGVLSLVVGSWDAGQMEVGFGPVASLPVALQFILVALAHDFLGYWIHRAFHTRLLWRFHIAHHSSRELDWMSLFRFHPVDNLALQIVRGFGLVMLGFPLPVIALYHGTVYFVVGVLAHSNIRMQWWSDSPLKYLIVAPAYHHWHHAAEPAAANKNLAQVLPLWDLLFGTYYFPDHPPARYGLDEEPPGFLGLMIQPLLPARAAEPRAELLAARAAESPAERGPA